MKPFLASFLVLSALAAAAPCSAEVSSEKIATDPTTGQKYRYVVVGLLDPAGTASLKKADWSVIRVRPHESEQPIPFDLSQPSGDPGRAVVTFRRGDLRNGDAVRITHQTVGSGRARTPVVDTVTIETDLPGDRTDFDITPGIAQGQELIGGGKRDVGQIALKGSALDAGTGVLLSTDSLVSSDGLDATSRIGLSAKKPFGLLPHTFSPAFVGLDVVGNQEFSNASLDLKFGFGPIVLPTPPLVSNQVASDAGVAFQPSRVPEFDFGVEGLHWLDRDSRVDDYHSERDAALVTANLVWGSVYFGRLFAERESVGDRSVTISRRFALALTASGYYFPNDRATGTASVRPFEGRVEASLLIPLPKLLKSDFKISYAAGADRANNFVRSNAVTFAFVTRS